MKKGIIKILTLLAVFCCGVLGFGKLMNHSNQDLTTEMADARLPLISLYMENPVTKEQMEINELRGYTAQMNGIYMRDAITPVSKERILPVQIRLYDTEVEGISYEIRSLDMDRLVADADVEDYEQKIGRASCRERVCLYV